MPFTIHMFILVAQYFQGYRRREFPKMSHSLSNFISTQCLWAVIAVGYQQYVKEYSSVILVIIV